nr:MAG TPA: hypothetical protein [Caudoviricetes sp.]
MRGLGRAAFRRHAEKLRRAERGRSETCEFRRRRTRLRSVRLTDGQTDTSARFARSARETDE